MLQNGILGNREIWWALNFRTFYGSFSVLPKVRYCTQCNGSCLEFSWRHRHDATMRVWRNLLRAAEDFSFWYFRFYDPHPSYLRDEFHVRFCSFYGNKRRWLWQATWNLRPPRCCGAVLYYGVKEAINHARASMIISGVTLLLLDEFLALVFLFTQFFPLPLANLALFLCVMWHCNLRCWNPHWYKATNLEEKEKFLFQKIRAKRATKLSNKFWILSFW